MKKDIYTLAEIVAVRQKHKVEQKKVIFTNGVFDILHRGHLEYLQAAKSLGDVLIVAVNTDASVRRFKDPKRPIVPEQDRAFLVSQLKPVDYVLLFDEDTPLEVISAIKPDSLVKGADYKIHEIVGHDVVQSYGGQVERIPLTPNRATTDIIGIIRERYGTSS